MNGYLLKALLSISLAFLISIDGLSTAAYAQNVPVRIEIVVVEGEGVTSRVHQRVAHDPVVRVEDDDHRPVAGAAVVFALPTSGTTGEFPNNSKSLTVLTDKNGQAAAHGLKAGETPGKLQIYTTASFHGLHARNYINQFIEAVPGTKVQEKTVQTSGSGGKWKWVVLGIVGAGGAGAGVYFGRHTSPSSPVSISTGAVVFGSPR